MYAHLVSRSRFIAAVSIFPLAIVLVACGGGGGGSTPTPPPATQTVTCPNGTSKTAATLDAADALCAAPALVSVSPANPNAAVSVDAFVSVDVVTDSTLDASTITATNVTLKAGTTSVAGAASAVGTKSFKFVPTAKLSYAQAYSFSATVKDTLGKTLTVNSTFTTAAVACVAPQVPNSTGNACIDPAPVVLHYTDKVYAIFTDAYPFVVTKTGPIRVKNMTPYNGLGKDLFGCVISSYALPNGKIPLLCKDLANIKYRELYINPEKDELYEYVGTLPSDLSYTLTASGSGITGLGAKWGDVAQLFVGYDFHNPAWSNAAKVSDGWYFTKNGPIYNDAWIIRFQDSFGVESIIYNGAFLTDGGVVIMFSYNN